MSITLTRAAWKSFAPKCPANYAEALFDNLDLLEQSGILETELRWCHFAATVYAETGGFTEIREDMRYSKFETLRKTWPSRFGHKSDDDLRPLIKNPVHLADVVYGCYSGRKVSEIGDVKPGEAYGYRGGGWFQTTFKPTVEAYCHKLGVEPTKDSLDDPVLTLKFAVIEWTEGRCNQYADANEIRKVAKVINTGSATNNVEPVGMDHRKAAFARAWKLWGESGTADQPAKNGPTIKQIATVGIGGAVAVQQTVEAAKPLIPSVPDAVQTAISNATSIRDATASVGDLTTTALQYWWLAIPIAGIVLAFVLFNRGDNAQAQ